MDVINIIKDYISEIRKKMPEVTDDILCASKSGCHIFYMNGENGTEFDWGCNHRTCEFSMFYKETKAPFLKVFVQDDDYITAYMYKKDYKVGDKSLRPAALYLGKDMGVYIAALMNEIADEQEKVDTAIDNLDFSCNVSDTELNNMWKILTGLNMQYLKITKKYLSKEKKVNKKARYMIPLCDIESSGNEDDYIKNVIGSLKETFTKVRETTYNNKDVLLLYN